MDLVARRLVVTVVLALLALSPRQANPQDWTATVDRVRSAFVRFEATLPDVTDHGVCTASRLSQGRFLTAAHCLEPNATYTIGKWSATVVKTTAMLALLTTNEPTATASVSLRHSAPVGLPVFIAGFAYDVGLKFTFGWVSAYGTWPNTPDAIVFVHVPIFPGYSGAAVLDAEGRLVGIAQANWAFAGSSMAIAVPASAIQAFLVPPPVLKLDQK